MPEFRELDFSEFHDLTHSVLDPECRGLPGGRLRHLSLWWEFVCREWIRRHTLCRAGWHLWVNWFITGVAGSRFVACRYCAKKRVA